MGKIYVLGIGPGAEEKMTIEAAEAMKRSDVIIGYNVYIDLIKDKYCDKELISTPMRQEKERCHIAFEKAMEEKTVSMICSGDSGVYGMASLMLEISPQYENTDIEIIPGVTAALSGSAVLGAALSHDFCVISLSDLLTPWEIIAKRIKAAAEADFCIAIYNPSSHKRADYLKKACDILLKYRKPENVCGYVENIGRDGENYTICSLGELRDIQVNMFTTVFIGSSRTRIINKKMVTPRGYIL